MDLRDKINSLYSIEEMAAGKTWIHRLHPAIKIVITMLYLIAVLSMGKYDIEILSFFFFYPFIVIALLDIPYRNIFRRSFVALPFVFFAGISNIIFDREILYSIGIVDISCGVVSFVVLIEKTFLSVTAVLILVASTPFTEITRFLRKIHIPEILAMLLEMTYRFVGVLAEEASKMVTAYRLRSNGRKWPKISEFSVFVGQLFLRSFSRSERIYQSMQCRLYPGDTVNNAKNIGSQSEKHRNVDNDINVKNK